MLIAEEDKFDVAIIGGGPSGIMAAIQAARDGSRVVLIEKNSGLGKKLLLTGKGRCNLTNAEFNLRKLVENYHNGEFLFHVFSIFGPKETIEFFGNLGIKIKTEANCRVFPKNGNAEEILEVLMAELDNKQVGLILNSEIVDIKKSGGKISKLVLKDREIKAKKYILCTGGKSYPLTGSNGFGYELAEKLGHTIIQPIPALSPVKLQEEWIKNLQGLNLRNIAINIFLNGKKQFSESGELIFTHFGISGPAVLNASGQIGDLLEKGEVKICLDLFPNLNEQEVLTSLEEIFKKYPRQTAKNVLSEFIPARFSEVILDVVKIDCDKIANNLSKPEKLGVAKILKNLTMTADVALGFNGAMVTRGGISLKEIDHKTMKSKIVDNLYFAGEILDIDGKTGGFNLQACWSTGYLAGQNASKP
jgi:predicted Rossmann fold flavoprotein